jgi:hypothetical protein
MTRHVVFVPSAPALLPIVSGAVTGLQAVRQAVGDALAALPKDEPPLLIASGRALRFGADAGGSLAEFGVPEAVVPGLPGALPWPLVVGRLLAADAGLAAGEAIAVDGSSAVELDGHRCVIVLGDGSACRTESSPGGRDPEAIGFDEQVAELLRSADAAALAELDLDLGRRLRADGVPAWRAVGAALRHRHWSASAVSLADPLGVGYLVGIWSAT